MPTTQLLSAIIERALNRVLSLDEQSASRMQILRDKRIRVTFQELDKSWVFFFSDQVMVFADDQDCDCSITLSLAAIGQLKDSSQLTTLIKQGKLQLDGDAQIAQAFSSLLSELDIDWEEHLAKYTGDFIAHQSGQLFRFVQHKTNSIFQHCQQLLRDTATVEKPIAAHPVAVQQFCQHVDELRGDAERLLARAERLLNKEHS